MSNTPIASIATPDPWILPHPHNPDLFYLTFTLGNRVEIWSSPQIEDFDSDSHTRKSLVWHPEPGSPWSANLWAPELHHINDTWYIYFCAAPPEIGNPGHRTTVLRSRHEDPMVSEAWEFLGPLKGMPDGQWSIDATVFSLPVSSSTPNSNDTNTQAIARNLYCCYSGWPLGDNSDTQQDLFLIQLSDPTTAITSTLTCISRATLTWERPENGRRGVNEGPTFLSFPTSSNNHFQGIVYSAHGSWGPDYKLALLALIDPTNPCAEQSWVKRPSPLLVCGDESMGPPYGPGHASFVHASSTSNSTKSEKENEQRVYCIYHATTRRDERWANRQARVISLGPEVFGPNAKPVCCAKSMLGARPGGGGWNDGSRGVRPPAEQGPGLVSESRYPAATGTGGAADRMPVGHMPGAAARIWNEFEKRVPDSRRGYTDKIKRFFCWTDEPERSEKTT